MQSTAAKEQGRATGVCIAAHAGSSLASCIESDPIQIVYVDTIQYKTFVIGLNFVMVTIHKPGKTVRSSSWVCLIE